MASRVLKYFLLTLFGFAVACILSSAFGASHIAIALIEALAGWFLRIAVLVSIFMATAIIWESLRE